MEDDTKTVEEWAEELSIADWALATARVINGWRALGVRLDKEEFKEGIKAALEVKFS